MVKRFGLKITTKCISISTVDYIVECLKGTIVDGHSVDWGFNSAAERMLNAVKLLPLNGAGTNGKI
jgi:hypothetical protein